MAFPERRDTNVGKSFQTEQESLASYHYRQMSAASFE
jgi:hypothetical protein